MHDPHGFGVRFSREAKRAAVRAYRSGMTTKAIAKLIGTSPTSVKNWIHEAGVKMRPAGVLPLDLPPLAELEALHAKFKSWRDVAYVIGVSYGACWRGVQRMRRERALLLSLAGAPAPEGARL